MSDVVTTRLVELEGAIEQGVEVVGLALAEIRDLRLYREDYATFGDYCRERWGWSRIHAHRMIKASEVGGLLQALPIGNKRKKTCKPSAFTPTKESHLRELGKTPEGERAEAWEEASKNGKPTAAAVRGVVEERKLPGPAEAKRQAKEQGTAVLASDGCWHQSGNIDHGDGMACQTINSWHRDMERLPSPEEFRPPGYSLDKVRVSIAAVSDYLNELRRRL